jgi:hypothetical protein
VTGIRASDAGAGDCKRFRCIGTPEAGLFQIVEVVVVGPFVFEGPEESLHDGVIIAAAGAAHGALDAECSQGLLIGVAGVLAAAIAVVQQLLARGSS